MTNYYNYQIGIFFGILIAGLVLLSLFVAAIYFGCVITMRPEKKKRYSPPNSVRAAPERQWQTAENAVTSYTNLYTSRATPTEYIPAVNSPLVNQPAVAATNQTPRELGVEQVYRPESAQYYQQRVGSTDPVQTVTTGGWRTAQPIQQVQVLPGETISVPVASYSPLSPQSPAAVAAFHTSSV